MASLRLSLGFLDFVAALTPVWSWPGTMNEAFCGILNVRSCYTMTVGDARHWRALCFPPADEFDDSLGLADDVSTRAGHVGWLLLLRLVRGTTGGAPKIR